MSNAELRSDARRLREEPWFYGVVVTVLVSVYGWAVYSSDALRGVHFAGFTLCMLAHGVLHVAVPRHAMRERWLPLYFVAQATLAWLINVYARGSGSAHAQYLYLILAIEAIAFAGAFNRKSLALASAVLALGLVEFLWLWGLRALPEYLAQAIPQTGFAIVLTALFFRQLNAQRHAEQLLRDLKMAHRQLAEYAGQVEDLTLAAERQRMARELHDTLTQGVAGLVMQLEAVDKQLERGNTARAQDITDLAMRQARETLSASRKAINDLRAGVGESDFEDQIGAVVAQFRTETGTACALEMGPMNTELSGSQKTQVLRIVAECLTNTARHARAQQTRVSLVKHADVLILVVADDGIGFATHQPGMAGHFGLLGIRERAQLLGGTCQIESAPDSGTCICVRIPLERGGQQESLHAG